LFKTILIVCVGNICRSPMGEYLLRQRAAAADATVSVASAGLGALVGHGADPCAVEIMNEHGVDMGAHRAQQLTPELVKQYELILVMERWQQREIESLYPFARGRVHLLGKWGDTEIADPYKEPKEIFLEAYKKIDMACNEWCKKLW
jgi:protein-tyrosine phosphatase